MEEFTNGIEIGISPIIFTLGPFSLRYFAFFIALGITLGLFVTLRRARSAEITEDAIWSVALWAIVFGIVGGRLFHVLDKIDYYIQNPELLASLAQSGQSLWGAILGGWLGAYLGIRDKRLSLARLCNLALPGVVLGLVIGRIGSLVNAESWGSQTSLPWGLIYTHPDARLPIQSLGVPTHPYPIYESLLAVICLGIVWLLRPSRWRTGSDWLLYLVLFGAGRFFIGFFREEGVIALGLQSAQMISAAVVLVLLPVLVYRLLGSAERGAKS